MSASHVCNETFDDVFEVYLCNETLIACAVVLCVCVCVCVCVC